MDRAAKPQMDLPFPPFKEPSRLLVNNDMPALLCGPVVFFPFREGRLTHEPCTIAAGTELLAQTLLVKGEALVLAASPLKAPRPHCAVKDRLDELTVFWIDARTLLRDGQDLQDIVRRTVWAGSDPHAVPAVAQRVIQMEAQYADSA